MYDLHFVKLQLLRNKCNTSTICYKYKYKLSCITFSKATTRDQLLVQEISRVARQSITSDSVDNAPSIGSLPSP